VRSDYEPVPHDEDPLPAVEPARGGRGSSLILGVLVSGGVAAAMLLTPRQAEALGAAVVLVWLLATPLGRRFRRRWLRTWPRRVLAGGGVGVLLAGWAADYFIPACIAVSTEILWGAGRGARARYGQPTDDVKPAVSEAPPERDWWTSAVAHTGLTVPAGPTAGEPLKLVGEERANGVGGQVLTVAVPPGLTPEDVAAAGPQLQAWLHVPWLYARRVSPEVMHLTELHCYRAQPLADPIPWQRLAEHARGGVGRIPLALDVFGDALHLDARKCWWVIGETDGGKTATQLAFIAGLAASGIPLQLHLADNRSDGDAELRHLADASAGYARTASEVWWQMHLLELESAARRASDLAADNRIYQPTAEWPLVHLVITELISLLRSRPPAEPLHGDWDHYTGGRFTAQPKVGEWREMIADSLGTQARESRSVGVSWSGGAQAGQMDQDGFSRFRRFIPKGQRIVMRVPSSDDVDPALGRGALAAGAKADDLPLDIPGLLYALPDGRTPHLARAAWVPPAEIKDVARELLRVQQGHRLWPASRGGNPA
jgi:hypothetical protein